MVHENMVSGNYYHVINFHCSWMVYEWLNNGEWMVSNHGGWFLLACWYGAVAMGILQMDGF